MVSCTPGIPIVIATLVLLTTSTHAIAKWQGSDVKNGVPLVRLATTGRANYCGNTWEHAGDCHVACPGGSSGECPLGQQCYAQISCTGSVPANNGDQYCGDPWSDAAYSCNMPCPSGDWDCPAGMWCFPNVPCGASLPVSRGQLYCGTSWSDASNSCAYPCPSGTGEECPSGQQCFAETSCTG